MGAFGWRWQRVRSCAPGWTGPRSVAQGRRPQQLEWVDDHRRLSLRPRLEEGLDLLRALLALLFWFSSNVTTTGSMMWSQQGEVREQEEAPELQREREGRDPSAPPGRHLGAIEDDLLAAHAVAPGVEPPHAPSSGSAQSTRTRLRGGA